jgi:RHS repeat-associated protein
VSVNQHATAVAVLGGFANNFARNGHGEVDHRDAKVGAITLFVADVLERDPTGRVISRNEEVAGDLHTYDYAYDAVGRLTDVSMDGTPSSHYEYDDNGNRLSRNAEAYTYDAQDRLLSAGDTLYTYDADGALYTRSLGTSTTEYRYDMAGNLLGVTLQSGDRIGYIVDAASRRVGRTRNGVVTHRWLYGADFGPAAEVDASGQIVSRFVYGTRSWVPVYVIKGAFTYALVTDAVGTVRLVVDTATGAIAQRLDYDEFGRVLRDTNPGFQPFGFGGGLYDPETGLVRIGARDYDSEVGRWTTKDPLLFGGGSTNLYAYVRSDPVNHVDPSGLIDEGDIADAAAGVGDAALRWLTFGLFNPGPTIRRVLGIDGIVNPCSKTYAITGAGTNVFLSLASARVTPPVAAESLVDLHSEAEDIAGPAGGGGIAEDAFLVSRRHVYVYG